MTSAVTDAAAAASDRARTMPLTPVDPPAAVIRALEDAALPRVDAETARRLVDLDRRFDRTVSRLRQELARRQEHTEEEPVARPAWGWDALGFLLALVAAPLLLAGLPGAGPALPAPVAAWAATLLVVAATTAHLIGARRTRRDGSSVVSSRHLVLLTAVVSPAVAALVAWRAAAAPGASAAAAAADAGVVGAIVLTSAAAAACVVLFARTSREARVEARLRRTARDAERGRRADLEAELGEAIEAAQAESRALLDALSAAQRDELRSATTAAVAALGRRQLLEPAVLRELRTADTGQLRYRVGL